MEGRLGVMSIERNRMSSGLKSWLESTSVQHFITTVIVVNAITLGLETSSTMMAALGPQLIAIDHLALAIFVIELAAKIIAYGWRFFASGWNIFDFAIVGTSLLPGAGTVSVLRALRILRVLRLFSVVPRLRTVVQALLDAIPNMASILVVLVLIFYVTAVLATQLFGGASAELFGTIGRSMYSLFQVMTLENWADGIVQPVMEIHPWAWAFFIPFIIVTSFAVLNLFIAILVSATEAQQASDRHEAPTQQSMTGEKSEVLVQEIATLREEVAALRSLIAMQNQNKVSGEIN
jgi:voltage-gated sodium channel